MFDKICRWTGRGGAAPVAIATSAAVDLPVLPMVDMADGLARLGNNPVRLRKAWLRFGETQAGTLTRIRTALGIGDTGSAVREAHTLKGLAATLGAHPLSAAAGALEEAIKTEDTRWPSLFDDTREQLEPLLAALKQLAELPPPGAANGQALDAEEVRSLLQRLQGQVADDDTAAAKTLDALEQALGSQSSALPLRELRKAIGDYDFDAAKDALRPLESALASTLQGFA
jgi:HPt (histidine-containing phosphotransfer) domain-containing protein